MAVLSRKKTILVIVLVILLGIFLPPNINGKRFSMGERLAAALSAALGRPVKIGSVNYRLLPRPGFDLYDFQVLDDPAFSAEPLLICGEVTADLRLTSLWQGRLEIANLKLKNATDRIPPSLNLVYANGHWNVESLLARAEQVPTAPTGKRRAERRARFPYIEADAGRINIKIGAEKKPYALINTDFGVWLAAEDQWHFRLEGRAARTDMNLSDTGTIKVEGDFKRSPGVRETPVTLQASWRQGQLGQLSSLALGRDKGWRGSLNLDAQVTGSLNDMHITAGGDLKDFRRYDIERAGMLRLISRCQGEYSKGLMGFSCNMPVESGLARFSGQVSPGTSLNYDLNVVANRIPLSALATFARQAKRTLPDDLNAGGEVDAAFAFHSHDNVPRDWHGTGMTSSFQLNSAQIATPVTLGPVRFHMGLVEAREAGPQEKRPARTKAAPPPEFATLTIEPFPIELGPASRVQASGSFSLSGYSLETKGNATLERLLDLGRVTGFQSHLTNTSGSANFDITASGVWTNFAPVNLGGTAHLENVAAAIPGVKSRLLLSSADAQFTDGALVLNRIAAQFEHSPVALRGSITKPLKCQSENPCALAFDLHAETLAAEDIAALLGGEQRGWNLPFISAAAENLPIFRAAGTLMVGTLKMAQLPLENFAAHLEVADQSLLISRISAKLADGTTQGDWRVDWDTSPPHYRGTGMLAAVSMEQLALPADTESLISEWISGKTNLKYSLELSGKSGAELLAGAAGHADFTAPNGISSALALESRPTRFQGLQGSCELAHQVLKLGASKFKAENRIYVLSGTISLAEKQAKLKVSNSITQWEITGNLEKPNVAAQRLTAEKTGSSVNTR